jgi:hypothetical protein
MIEIIRYKRKIYGIIIRNKIKLKYNSIKFFTPRNFSQQLGYMNRPKGYKISAHKHKKNIRNVSFTQEVIFLKEGQLRVNFYHQSKKFFKSKTLNKGDIVLLANGGHGFEMLKNSKIFEVKQGPYNEFEDKIIF